MAFTNTTEARQYSIITKRVQAPNADITMATTISERFKNVLFYSFKDTYIALLAGAFAKRLIFRRTHPKCLTEILTRLLCCLSVSLANPQIGRASCREGC